MSYVVIMSKRDTISVTIRLPKDLVEWIDSHVDGVENRNRTHVIEKALNEFKKKN
jgi:Arc/MetJ-type ribon-helix-helix transcriptional regulator